MIILVDARRCLNLWLIREQERDGSIQGTMSDEGASDGLRSKLRYQMEASSSAALAA
jgi:hypothetical protein